MLNLIQTLQNNSKAAGCFPFVGHISTLHQWNENDYPFIGIQFDSADTEINYQFTLYYLEVLPENHGELVEEAIMDRGIKTLIKIIKDLYYTNANFEAIRNTGTDCTSGVVLTVTFIDPTNPECL